VTRRRALDRVLRRDRRIEQFGEQIRRPLGSGHVERERASTKREADAELEKGTTLVLAADDGVDLPHPLGGRGKAEPHAAWQCGALHRVVGQTEQQRLPLSGELLAGERACNGTHHSMNT
jgi:hypothetical protein